MLIFILTLRNMNFWNVELKLEQHFQQDCLGLFLHSTQGCFIHSAFHWNNISTGNKSFTFIIRETPKLKSPYSLHAEVGISRVPRSSNSISCTESLTILTKAFLYHTGHKYLAHNLQLLTDKSRTKADFQARTCKDCLYGKGERMRLPGCQLQPSLAESSQLTYLTSLKFSYSMCSKGIIRCLTFTNSPNVYKFPSAFKQELNALGERSGK